MTASVDLFGRPDEAGLSVRQLPLPLSWRAGMPRMQQFLVSASNRQLLNAVLDWQGWAMPLALLTGPRRCGKTLLAAHAAEQTGVIRALDQASALDETALFHACTAALTNRAPLLVVAESGWQPQLRDLATRMAAAQDFAMPDPNDELLAALLERRMAAHHLAVTADVVLYVAQRMERSFAALDIVADQLVEAALSSGRSLSLPFIRMILDGADAGSTETSADVAAA